MKIFGYIEEMDKMQSFPIETTSTAQNHIMLDMELIAHTIFSHRRKFTQTRMCV